VIPVCTAIEANRPDALCSRGAINVQLAPYGLTYKALLVRVEKRLAHGTQFLASYTYSHNVGANVGNGFSLENALANVGPSPNDVPHLLNVGGVVRLPLSLDLGFNFSFASAAPFTAFLGNIDFDGDGTTGDLLPGTTVNVFNRGLDRQDLARLVREFNARYGGRSDARGTPIPQLTLPTSYALGDNYHSLDIRISRSIPITGHSRATLLLEAFNVYNAANLSGFAGDLTSPGTFGQPVSRATQVFGSGGPRSIQLGARFAF